MGTKLNPGPYDCYSRALPDEPLFTLLARDPMAPDLVRRWAEDRMARINAGQLAFADTAGVAEAAVLAHSMEVWRTANDGRWRTEKAPEALIDQLKGLLRATEADGSQWVSADAFDELLARYGASA
jgi:hypothetical protein